LCPLRGGVCAARDRDGNGLEDTLVKLWDGLSAPYGIAAGPGHIDVLHRAGLWRLHDADGDDVIEKMTVAASGWGHTEDYHDWAVGLEQDAAGAYYAALVCHYDERSEPARRHRGQIVRLVPSEPTDPLPRLFSIEPLAGGHRFPMGIVRTRAGDLATSDNQGHFNPYNEINVIRPGRRYGFLNPGENAADLPAPEHPAVGLPHPWTRSVNGLALLSAPPPAADDQARAAEARVAPYGGHLVGCEYDERALIRFTFDCVDDVVQGAAYPFTRPVEDLARALEGPVCARVGPHGDLYVGNLRDAGWGSGQNTGSIVRLRRAGDPGPGILSAHARADGLEIRFTEPLDPAAAGDPTRYHLESFRRRSTPEYGGADLDRRRERLEAVVVAPDRRSVLLRLGPWREGHVYALHVDRLAPGGRPLFPAEAYYTLLKAPR
jgi:hypothetical protein